MTRKNANKNRENTPSPTTPPFRRAMSRSPPNSPRKPMPPSQRKPNSSYLGSRLPAYNMRAGINRFIPQNFKYKPNQYYLPRPPSRAKSASALRVRNSKYVIKTFAFPKNKLKTLNLQSALKVLRNYSINRYKTGISTFV